ncbi:MAG: acyltransferase domain-containing protein [Bacteroidota bacterium]
MGSGRFSFEHVAARLRIPSAGQALCTGWDAAMRIPPSQALPFLEPDYIAWSGREVGLTDGMIGALVAFAVRITEDEDVVAFFSYCRHRVLYDRTLVSSWEEQWPPLDDYLGRDAGLLNVLVMLSAVPEMRETYRRLGIPSQIVRDTVADLRRWMETDIYYQRYQRWGITPWIARWLCKHWQGKLLHLKRLQFNAGKFDGKLRAYRRRGKRELIAISEPDICYCADGKAWGGVCCGDGAGTWTSTLAMTDEAVVGNPIAPDGHARPRTVRLSLDEWEPVLAPGDEMLIFHIPAGGPMAFEDCGESFRQAMEVFPRYFPEVRFRGFTTGSWLLDPRLEALLSPESNIVRLQREMYLYPGIQGHNDQVYQRVFGWGVTDLKDAPRRTSLQQAVARYLEAGGHFHGGYCFLLKDDFHWGSRVYRTADPSRAVSE